MYNYLITIALALVNIFLGIHLCTGEFSALKTRANYRDIARAKTEQQKLQAQQKQLENEIRYLQTPANVDYLQTIALNKFNHIPAGWKIIKLDPQ